MESLFYCRRQQAARTLRVIMLSPADIVRSQLAPLLGPFTAKNAVLLIAKRNLGMEPEQLRLAEMPALLEALTPTLRTLLGRESTDQVLMLIRKDLRLG